MNSFISPHDYDHDVFAWWKHAKSVACTLWRVKRYRHNWLISGNHRGNQDARVAQIQRCAACDIALALNDGEILHDMFLLSMNVNYKFFMFPFQVDFLMDFEIPNNWWFLRWCICLKKLGVLLQNPPVDLGKSRWIKLTWSNSTRCLIVTFCSSSVEVGS